MPREFRRFVTGLNESGQSVLTFEDTAASILDIAGWPGARLTDVWTTAEMPVDNSGDADRAGQQVRHDPEPLGSIFRMVEIPPEGSISGKIDTAAAFASMSSRNVPTEEDQAQHGSMHVTDTVDYLVIVEGEMHMLLEEGEVLLKAGDCIVQRGTKHAWINRSDSPCILAAVLIDAHPLK